MPLNNMTASIFTRLAIKVMNDSLTPVSYFVFALCLISTKADYRKGRENNFHFK